jgi:hypothetical protein
MNTLFIFPGALDGIDPGQLKILIPVLSQSHCLAPSHQCLANHLIPDVCDSPTRAVGHIRARIWSARKRIAAANALKYDHMGRSSFDVLTVDVA